MRRGTRRFALFAFAAAWTAAFITPLCGYLFRCGCRQLWLGAADLCNIHNAAPPHCPFCSHGAAGFWLGAAGMILAAQWIVVAVTLRWTRSGALALLGAVAAFFAAGASVAWIFALHDHYSLFRVLP